MPDYSQLTTSQARYPSILYEEVLPILQTNASSFKYMSSRTLHTVLMDKLLQAHPQASIIFCFHPRTHTVLHI